LQTAMPDKHIVLSLWLHEDGSIVTQYTITRQFFFLIGDDWCTSYDSRYSGLVCASQIRGTAAAVLWSLRPGAPLFRGVRTGRLCKIIR
jgi:hypothetical protein